MGITIKKRFGPRNFVQYLHLNDVYSVGPKPKKKQQVVFNNPQDYIIPQSAVNNALYNAQQAETVENRGAAKAFAKYYGGTGDNRSFVWTAKPIPPVATSMDRLGEDFDRNFGINQQNMQRLANQKVWRAQAGRFEKKTAHLAASQRFRDQFKNWLVQSEIGAIKRDAVAKLTKQMRKQGADKIASDQFLFATARRFFNRMMQNQEFRQGDELLLRRTFNGLKREARARVSRVRKIAGDVFDERHRESMVIKGLENAPGPDPQAFFPAAGTNIQAEAKLSNEAKRLVESKGMKMSPDPQGRKPRGHKGLPPGHIGHISPPKESKDGKK